MKITSEQKQAIVEGLKEVARLGLLFVGSWIITETMAQINLVPQFHEIKVWVFTYIIPIRSMFHFGLTMSGRFLDKWVHEIGKTREATTGEPSALTKGITRF